MKTKEMKIKSRPMKHQEKMKKKDTEESVIKTLFYDPTIHAMCGSPDCTGRVFATGCYHGDKKFPAGPMTRWAIRFFLLELENQEVCDSNSLMGGVIEYLRDHWWLGELKPTDKERNLFEQKSKNKNCWLNHYRIWYETSAWVLKPKTDPHTFERMGKILGRYLRSCLGLEDVTIGWNEKLTSS